MASVQVGERVGAVHSAGPEQVNLFGFGVYDGEHEAPFGPFGAPKEVIEEMKLAGDLPEDFVFKNPRITLDNGSVVWGCQCWWGPEDKVKEMIGERQINFVDAPT